MENNNRNGRMSVISYSGPSGALFSGFSGSLSPVYSAEFGGGGFVGTDGDVGGLFERVVGLTKISGEREAVILDGTNGNEFESAVRSAFGDLHETDAVQRRILGNQQEVARSARVYGSTNGFRRRACR